MSINPDIPHKKRRTCDGIEQSKRSTNDDIKTVNAKAEENAFSTKRHKKYFPKFRLKNAGTTASLSASADERVPLVLTDIQYLLLHSLLGNLNLTQPPRWYVLDKCERISQTTCLVLEGVSIRQWEKYSEQFINANEVFEDFIEMLTPSIYDGSLVQELALVSLSEVEKDAIIQKYGSMNLALEARKDLLVMMKAVFPIGNSINEPIDFSCEDQYPRTQLMLSAWQLLEENYPVPLKGKLKTVYSDYVMTKAEYAPVTSKSPMFGLDCEMCITNAGSELTRVSIVNEKHETVYESLVKPYNNITDYLTRFSGITKPMLSDISKRLEDVQNDIRELLPPDAILVGQSLNTDLHALKMMHPYIIDTSIIYNFTGQRTRKPKLKALAREFLNVDIQSGKNGHCSVEDALASLKLVQLKLCKNIEFGDAVHTNRQKYKENINKMKTTQQYALSIFNHIIEQKKSSLIIGCDNITGDYHTYLTKAKDSITSQLKKGKPKKVKLSTVDEEEEVIAELTASLSSYNFTMAHLKLCLNDDNELDQTRKIDGWIRRVWENLGESSLFAVVFGGTNTDNGMAMIKIKNNL